MLIEMGIAASPLLLCTRKTPVALLCSGKRARP